jgi:hypothetical protein
MPKAVRVSELLVFGVKALSLAHDYVLVVVT